MEQAKPLSKEEKTKRVAQYLKENYLEESNLKNVIKFLDGYTVSSRETHERGRQLLTELNAERTKEGKEPHDNFDNIQVLTEINEFIAKRRKSGEEIENFIGNESGLINRFDPHVGELINELANQSYYKSLSSAAFVTATTLLPTALFLSHVALDPAGLSWAAAQNLCGGFTGLEIADWLSGGLHIWKDQEPYGDKAIPIHSRHIAYSYQVHHFKPNDMLNVPFWNLYGRLRDAAMVPALLTYLSYYMGWLNPSILLAINSGLFIFPFQQVLHIMTHGSPNDYGHPKIFKGIKQLQKKNLPVLNKPMLASAADHATHHKKPYGTNFAIVTGHTNFFWNWVRKSYGNFLETERGKCWIPHGLARKFYDTKSKAYEATLGRLGRSFPVYS